MKAQLTITVPAGKRLIAEAIRQMSVVQRALERGKILLKGGTTVAAVSERLTGDSLRISGRISPRGSRASLKKDDTPHNVLLEQGRITNIDACFKETIQGLSADDVVIIGANALDMDGRAAIMLGSPLGGAPGMGMAGLMAQGCKVIIACGLEKLIPTPIDAAVQAAGMRAMDWSMGMAVGLMPLIGEVVTEKVALERLAAVRAVVIGAGGIDGAEGAATIVLEGAAEEVERAIAYVLSCQDAVHGGNRQSLQECVPGSPGCAEHRACAWRKQKDTRILSVGGLTTHLPVK